ncbi:MAG TPA: helix-turn-helix domain-containing protein, partial [Mycobacteriales bacterium]|nr:helix-turn-helix domain-containing protein [Mycobacteriales bacterium]
MDRTRAAVLEGAVRAVEKYGARRATMADIAALSGVAKGTLYNHFRTKDAVYVATLEQAIRDLGAEAAALALSQPGTVGLTAALSYAAERIATSPALRRLALEEPGTAMSLAAVGTGVLWERARENVRGVLLA